MDNGDIPALYQGSSLCFTGMLVVNVTWRNKTYVGTLLDCTRHDWAPPRYVKRFKILNQENQIFLPRIRVSACQPPFLPTTSVLPLDW